MSITKDQSLKESCSSREVAPNIHYIFLGKNVQEVLTFCHGSCVSFNHLLVTGRGDQFARAVATFFLSTANGINKSWLLHNLRLFSFLSMYETFTWKY